MLYIQQSTGTWFLSTILSANVTHHETSLVMRVPNRSNKTPPMKPDPLNAKTAMVNAKVSRSSCPAHSLSSSSACSFVEFTGAHRSLKYPSPFKIKTMFAQPNITPENKAISITPHAVKRRVFHVPIIKCSFSGRYFIFGGKFVKELSHRGWYIRRPS